MAYRISRHSSQNVWRHVSVFGRLKLSEQIWQTRNWCEISSMRAPLPLSLVAAMFSAPLDLRLTSVDPIRESQVHRCFRGTSLQLRNNASTVADFFFICSHNGRERQTDRDRGRGRQTDRRQHWLLRWVVFRWMKTWRRWWRNSGWLRVRFKTTPPRYLEQRNQTMLCTFLAEQMEEQSLIYYRPLRHSCLHQFEKVSDSTNEGSYACPTAQVGIARL